MQLIRPVVNKIRFNSISRKIFYPDFEEEFVELYYRFQNLTMTSPERMYGLYKAVRYVLTREIPGDLVEAGVWKGGSAMICAALLKSLKDRTKKLYLYDTYSGMPEPSDKDINYLGEHASKFNSNLWCFASLEEVKRNVFSTGISKEKIIFVRGKVEETIPQVMPEKISLLRLDTDYFESTYHELCNLYPRLSKYGVLIVDDYGYWKGSKEAVDKYFRENKINMFLNRLDYGGRLGIKE